MRVLFIILSFLLWMSPGEAMELGHLHLNGAKGRSHTLPHDSLEKSLLDSFEEVLAATQSNPDKMIPHLERIRKENRYHGEYGSPELNEGSLIRWMLYSRALFILSETPANRYHEKDKVRFKEQLQRKERRLDNIEAYIPDGKMEDYPLYLEGIWQEVATFNSQARRKLIEAYNKGDTPLALNHQKARFWEEYIDPSGSSN